MTTLVFEKIQEFTSRTSRPEHFSVLLMHSVSLGVMQMDKREADDPCFYLLAIWNPGTSLKILFKNLQRHHIVYIYTLAVDFKFVKELNRFWLNSLS